MTLDVRYLIPWKFKKPEPVKRLDEEVKGFSKAAEDLIKAAKGATEALSNGDD